MGQQTEELVVDCVWPGEFYFLLLFIILTLMRCDDPSPASFLSLPSCLCIFFVPSSSVKSRSCVHSRWNVSLYGELSSISNIQHTYLLLTLDSDESRSNLYYLGLSCEVNVESSRHLQMSEFNWRRLQFSFIPSPEEIIQTHMKGSDQSLVSNLIKLLMRLLSCVCALCDKIF